MKRLEITRAPSRAPAVVGPLIAFALGALLIWLLMRPSEPLARAGAGLPAATPPDVSRLAPTDGAVALANWNYDRQNWAHAIEHYEQAIAAGTDNPDVRTDLGNCFRFLGQGQKALEQYQIAQKQNPLHENSLYNQAGVYSEVLHQPEQAKAAAQQFIARFPQSPRAESARKFLAESDTERQRVLEWMNTRK